MVEQQTEANGNERLIDAPSGRAHQIIARSMYRELRDNGYTPAQILALSAELISLVTTDYGSGPGEL
jgi:hypothetical protein